jgi:hypothetical protein
MRRRLNLADRIETLLMTASCVPFPTALRAELRDQVGPHHVMAGVADLLANIAKTIVRTLIDAPQTLRTLRSCALRPVSSPARCSTKRSMPRRPRCVPKSRWRSPTGAGRTEDGDLHGRKSGLEPSCREHWRSSDTESIIRVRMQAEGAPHL